MRHPNLREKRQVPEEAVLLHHSEVPLCRPNNWTEENRALQRQESPVPLNDIFDNWTLFPSVDFDSRVWTLIPIVYIANKRYF